MSNNKVEEAIFEHNVAMIIVNKTIKERTAYDAARYAWRVTPEVVSQADYILAVAKGEIVGVFIADEWKSGSASNFPEFAHIDAVDRYGFVGRDAPKEVVQRYLYKRIPSEYRKFGMASPVRYNYTYDAKNKIVKRKIFDHEGKLI